MKKYILWVIIPIVIVVLAFSIRPIFKITSEMFWNYIGAQLDKEEQERQQKAENGEIIYGKDTVLIWGNKYEIGHYADGNHLEIKIGEMEEIVLMRVKEYKIFNEKLYIVSEEGDAVIDKDNICKVFIMIPSKTITTDSHIQYINAYEEFSEEEQTVFKEMKKL